MCQECGCGLGVAPHRHDSLSSSVEVHTSDEPNHHHGTDHHGSSSRTAEHPSERPQVVAIQRSLLERNDRLAEQNRGFFRAKQVLVLNLLSAPGSGKTTFIQKTAEILQGRLRMGVITGDLATENDANRLRAAGLPVAQITTGTVCHLEADMVARAVDQINLDNLDLLVIENVGNLVCPASYDLGEQMRVVLLSVTEGEDKPLKYPPLFHSAHVAILTKSDLAEPAGFDRETALANLRRISHHAEVMEVSARTGDGMDAWVDFLLRQHSARAGAHSSR